jgi:hypothetical protein
MLAPLNKLGYDNTTGNTVEWNRSNVRMLEVSMGYHNTSGNTDEWNRSNVRMLEVNIVEVLFCCQAVISIQCEEDLSMECV